MFKHQLCEFLSFRSRVPLQTQNRLQHISVSITQTTKFLHEVMSTSAGNEGFASNQLNSLYCDDSWNEQQLLWMNKLLFEDST